MYYVYVLYGAEQDKLYIGFTEDLKKRIKEHQRNTCHTTKRLSNFELVYYEACKAKKDATNREKQLKTGFGRGYLRKRVSNYLTKLPGSSMVERATVNR